MQCGAVRCREAQRPLRAGDWQLFPCRTGFARPPAAPKQVKIQALHARKGCRKRAITSVSTRPRSMALDKNRERSAWFCFRRALLGSSAEETRTGGPVDLRCSVGAWPEGGMQGRQGPARPDGFGQNHPWDPVHSNQMATPPPCLAYRNPEHKLGLHENPRGTNSGGGGALSRARGPP